MSNPTSILARIFGRQVETPATFVEPGRAARQAVIDANPGRSIAWYADGTYQIV